MSTLFDKVSVNRSAFHTASRAVARRYITASTEIRICLVPSVIWSTSVHPGALRQLLKHHSTFMLWEKILDDCREEPWKNTEEPDEVALFRFGHESGESLDQGKALNLVMSVK